MNKTKKELILAVFEEEGFEELNEQAVIVINRYLAETYGRGAQARAGYIAEVLSTAGKRIHYNDEWSGDEPDTLAQEFTKSINFDSLASAEQAVLMIDNRFRALQASSDEEGLRECRQFVQYAQLRARLIANNERVPEPQRKLKQEIAFWLDLWLATPDLFADWLALRRNSPDYKALFEIGCDNEG